jgi:hypothetical protein
MAKSGAHGVSLADVNNAQSGAPMNAQTLDAFKGMLGAYQGSDTYKTEQASTAADTAKTAAANAVQNYQTPEFKFNPNSLSLSTARANINQGAQQAGQQAAQAIAQRGAVDSGQLNRSLAATNLQAGQMGANATAGEYGAQQNQANLTNAQNFNQMLQKYQISADQSKDLMDKFYANQAQLQSNAYDQWSHSFGATAAKLAPAVGSIFGEIVGGPLGSKVGKAAGQVVSAAIPQY